jgi:hypothetical protein
MASLGERLFGDPPIRRSDRTEGLGDRCAPWPCWQRRALRVPSKPKCTSRAPTLVATTKGNHPRNQAPGQSTLQSALNTVQCQAARPSCLSSARLLGHPSTLRRTYSAGSRSTVGPSRLVRFEQGPLPAPVGGLFKIVKEEQKNGCPHCVPAGTCCVPSGEPRPKPGRVTAKMCLRSPPPPPPRQSGEAGGEEEEYPERQRPDRSRGVRKSQPPIHSSALALAQSRS